MDPLSAASEVPGVDGLTPGQILAGLDRALASAEFAASAQLSRFLRHVVENAMQGRTDALKESVIGVSVFRREASYDPKADPIVRVEARRLRTRLDSYYSNAGSDDPIRISLPKGGYLPVFRLSQPPEPVEPEIAEPDPAPSKIAPPTARNEASHLDRTLLLWAILATAAVLAAATYTLSAQDRAVTRFWSEILSGDQPALIIPADSGLVMLQDLTHHPVSLAEYITGEYRTRVAGENLSVSDLAASLSARRYTSIADLEFSSALSHRPEAARKGVLVRYARDVRVDDLKDHNLVLLGARHSNPWVELVEKDAGFRLEHDEQTGVFRILNSAPQAGEPASIVIAPDDFPKQVYGIITFHAYGSGSGRALVVAGTTVAGTEAAADFLVDESRMLPLLRKAESGRSIKGFDILLRGRSIAGSAPGAEVVAFHSEH